MDLQQENWPEECQLKGDYVVQRHNSGQATFVFTAEEDAVMFKLRWQNPRTQPEPLGLTITCWLTTASTATSSMLEHNIRYYLNTGDGNMHYNMQVPVNIKHHISPLVMQVQRAGAAASRPKAGQGPAFGCPQRKKPPVGCN
jgi:hypothetical protein